MPQPRFKSQKGRRASFRYTAPGKAGKHVSPQLRRCKYSSPSPAKASANVGTGAHSLCAGSFALSTLHATGAGFATPTINTLCSEATPEPRQGEMFGLLQAARSFGFLLGPLLGSARFDWRGEAPYLLAGAVLLAAAVSTGADAFFAPSKELG